MPEQTGEPRPEYRYHLLRAASERFQCDLATLDQTQLAEAVRQAQRTFELETLVLSAPEAQDLPIPPERIDLAVAELKGRYPDPDAFESDLARNGLDLPTLRSALHRELIFDAVMQRVGVGAEAVDELEERLFYELQPERFTVPERRTARHILITVNESFAENRRDAARARIERIRDGLRDAKGGPKSGRTQRFGALARKFSECPTALEDGRLGDAVVGKLYPELDALLFRLREGEVGGPVESELGFHLVYCERIQPARTLPFSKVQEQIREALAERGRHNRQKEWIAALRQAATGQGTEPGGATGDAPAEGGIENGGASD